MIIDNRTFQKTVKPIYYIYKLFCLAPYEINAKKFQPLNIVIWHILQCLILEGAVTIAVMITYYRTFTIYKQDDLALQVNYVMEVGIGYIATLMSISTVFINRVKICEIYEGLVDIDSTFRKLGFWVPYKCMSYWVKCEIVLFLSVFIIHLSCRIYKHDSSYDILILLFGVDFAFYMAAISMSQFSNIVWLLHQRIKLINAYLKTLNESQNRIFVMPKNGHYNDLLNVMEIQNKIFKYSATLNDIYASNIVFICACMFQNIVAEMYQLYKNMIFYGEWNSSIPMIFKWILNSYGMLFLISTPCERIKNEVCNLL